MHNYFVRVEMHGAYESDYAILHNMMELAGFNRYIKDGNGDKFELLRAEYINIHHIDIDAILSLASSIANQVHPDASVFVVKFSEARWDNLVSSSQLHR